MNWKSCRPLAALVALIALIGGSANAQLSDVTQPGDPIVPTSANSPASESVANAIDNNAGTKYLNFDKLNAGFTVTPSVGRTLVQGLALTSANDAPPRDPASFKLEGSDNGTSFTLIASNRVPAFSARSQRIALPFSNNTTYLAYRLTFPTVSNAAAATSMQIAEVELLGLPCQSYTIPIRPGYQLIANHLDNGGNTLNEIMPNVPEGTTLYKFNNATGSFEIATYAQDDNGNLFWSPNLRLNPGEGAYLFNGSGAAFNLTFNGKPHTPVLPVAFTPGGNCYLLSRQTLGPGTYDNIVGAAPEPGTRVYRFTGLGFTISTYDADLGGWDPAEPNVAVGESMWICCPTCSPPPQLCTPPAITVQPQPANQIVEACSCVTNSVTANGTAPLTYQWQRNGVNIPGASGSTYIICPVKLADSGSYRVVIGNACGSVTSVAVALTVLDKTAPNLRCPTNDLVVPGTNATGAVVTYAVSATDCDPAAAVVCAPASGALFPCGTTTVTCHASDSTGNASDCSFRVIVVCDCMAVLHERIQAVPAVPGKFNYSFDYYNYSGVPVKYLFVVPKSGCLTASPDIITFKPPVPPGGVTNVSVMLMLGAGCSTGLCLTVSAHDTNLVRCCSTMRCLPNSLKPSPKITLAGTSIVICWPDVFPDYVVECTTALASPSVWSPSPIPRTLANGNFCVTVPLTGRAKFYRLRQP